MGKNRSVGRRRKNGAAAPEPECTQLFAAPGATVWFGCPRMTIKTVRELAKSYQIGNICVSLGDKFKQEFMTRLKICKNGLPADTHLDVVSPSEMLCVRWDTRDTGSPSESPAARPPCTVFVADEKKMASPEFVFSVHHAFEAAGRHTHILVVVEAERWARPTIPRKIKLALRPKRPVVNTLSFGIAHQFGGPGACVASCQSSAHSTRRTLVLCGWPAPAVDSVTNPHIGAAVPLADALADPACTAPFCVVSLDDSGYFLCEAAGGWAAVSARAGGQCIYFEQIIAFGDGTSRFWNAALQTVPFSSTVFFVPEVVRARIHLVKARPPNTHQSVTLSSSTKFTENSLVAAALQAVRSFNKVADTANLVDWWGIGIACIVWPGATPPQVVELLRAYLPATVGDYKLVVRAGFACDGATRSRRIVVNVLDSEFSLEISQPRPDLRKLYHCFCVVSPDKQTGRDIPALWRITYGSAPDVDSLAGGVPRAAQHIAADVRRAAKCALGRQGFPTAGRLRIVVEGFTNGQSAWVRTIRKAAAFLYDAGSVNTTESRRGCGLVARLVAALLGAMVVFYGGPESRATNIVATAARLQRGTVLPPMEFNVSDIATRHAAILSRAAPACYKILEDNPPSFCGRACTWDHLESDLTWLGGLCS